MVVLASLIGAAPAMAQQPAPPARAGLGGVSTVRVADGLAGAVMLRVGSTGKRVRSRWTVLASCGKGVFNAAG